MTELTHLWNPRDTLGSIKCRIYALEVRSVPQVRLETMLMGFEHYSFPALTECHEWIFSATQRLGVLHCPRVYFFKNLRMWPKMRYERLRNSCPAV